MHRASVYFLVFFAFLSLSCSISPKAPPTQSLLKDDYSLVIEYLQKYVPTQMKKHNFTGLSVALVDDQKVVWSEGFGFADKAAGIRATESTAYRAGSVSKLFTAMAVMKLQSQQKLDLDAPIRASVPEFNLKSRFGSIDKITLRNILSHHAGIPSAILDGMWASEPESYKSATARLNRYYAAYPPNTVFAYSNAGYSVAGHAVENSSGMPFADYVNNALLTSLQMDHSNFDFDTSGEKVAKSYWNGKEVEELALRDLPAGGLVTTVGDLSNLVKLVNANGFYKSQVFTPQIMQEMLSVQAYDSAFEPDGINGIGWLNYSGYLDGKYAAVGHTGQTLAHSGSVVIVPEIKLGVVLLSTSPSLRGGLEEITAKVLQVAHSVNTRTALSSVPAIDKFQKPLPGTEIGFDGRYASSFGFLDISRHNESYKVIVDGKKMALSKSKTGSYSLRVKLLGFIPVKPPGIGDLSFFAREVSGEKIILAKSPAGRTTVVATEIDQQQRNSTWDARLGEYAITNPIDSDNPFFKIDSVTMAYKDGFYNLDVSTPMGVQQVPLKVINETEATFQGYGRGLGETVIIQPDGSLLHAGWVFEKLSEQPD